MLWIQVLFKGLHCPLGLLLQGGSLSDNNNMILHTTILAIAGKGGFTYLKAYSLIVLIATTLGGFVHQSLGQASYARGYAPAYVQCPANIQWIRPAIGLSQPESEWVQGRKKVVLA